MSATPSYSSCTNLQRRTLLGGAIAAGALQFAPRSWAASVADTDAFAALSQYLTQRTDLSADISKRTQAALQNLDGNFNALVDAMWQWVQAGNVPVSELNVRLKTEKPELAALPGQIMQAWYLGIAGDGEKATVVTYEFALNAQTVSDKLKPPTYAYGLPGSWASNPTTSDLQRVPAKV